MFVQNKYKVLLAFQRFSLVERFFYCILCGRPFYCLTISWRVVFASLATFQLTLSEVNRIRLCQDTPLQFKMFCRFCISIYECIAMYP